MQERLSPVVEEAQRNEWVVHMVGAADVVYADLHGAQRWLEARGCTAVRRFDAGGTQALGYLRNGFRCVVFRGTQEAEDWVTDLQSFYWSSPPVHFGFQRSWDAVQKDVTGWLKATPAANGGVYLCGHSLGGAIATIAALDWTRQGGEVEQVITFGSPRTGSWEFAERYDSANLSEKTLRYTHDQDGICVIPPRLLFWHVAPALKLEMPDRGEPVRRQPGLLPEPVTAAPGVFESLVVALKPALMGAAPAAGAVLSMLDEKSDSIWMNPKKTALRRVSLGGAQFLFLLVPAGVQLVVSAPVVAGWLAGHAHAIFAGIGEFLAWLVGTFLALLLVAAVTLRGEYKPVRLAVWFVLSMGAAFGMAWGILHSPPIVDASAKAVLYAAVAAGFFVTQQFLFLILFVASNRWVRLVLSCAGAGALLWSWSSIPMNGLLTLVVGIAGLMTILVYRFAAGVMDHMMEHYLLAIVGSGSPAPREQAKAMLGGKCLDGWNPFQKVKDAG